VFPHLLFSDCTGIRSPYVPHPFKMHTLWSITHSKISKNGATISQILTLRHHTRLEVLTALLNPVAVFKGPIYKGRWEENDGRIKEKRE